MDFKYVYKICTYEEWEEAKEKGKYEGSKKDKEDGFIHFSDVEQLKREGCNDGEILEVNQVVAYFNYSNRLLNGLGVSLDGDKIGYYSS